MKKYLNIFVAVLLSALTVSLASCSKDDDEPSMDNSSKDKIEGSWQVESAIAEAMSSNQFMQFRNDGTFYEIIEYTGDMSFFGTVYQEGTWTLSGSDLKISVKNPIKVKKVTSKELILEESGIEVKCKKVSDEIVNKLLLNAEPM